MLNRLKIAHRLYLSFGLMLAILLLMVMSTAVNFTRVANAVARTDHTYQVLLEDDKLLTALVNIETGQRGFLLTGGNGFLDPLHKGEKEFSEAFARISKLTSDNPAQQDSLQKLQKIKDEWMKEYVNPMIEMRRSVTTGAATLETLSAEVAKAEGKTRMDDMRGVLTSIANEQTRLLAQRAKESEEAKSSTMIMLITSGLISALIGIATAWQVSRSIGRRLAAAVAVADAAARGDFSARIDTGRDDEIGALMRAFANMQHQLRELLGNVRESARQLLDGAAQISTSSGQIANGAREQSSAASAMAAAVEQLTVSINHVADSAREAHQSSAESGRISDRGGDVIQQTVTSIERIAGTVRTAADSVTELGTQAAQISSIVNVIKEIADQTNLLALNAAIEAARAGETGRGFAVVADEVRQLAERTTASTQEIAQMIAKIQSGTNGAVRDMKEGVGQVEKGMALASQAGSAIGQIRQGSTSVAQAVTDISDALKEQSVVANDVASNVERIARMSEENTRAVESTAATVEGLRQLALALDQAVARFRLV